MISKRQLVIGLLVPVLALQLACHKKQAGVRPKLPGPAEAPTLTQTLPYEIKEAPVPEASAETAKVQEAPKTKSKPHPRTNSKKAQPNQPGTQVKTAGTPTSPPSAQAPAPAASETTTASIHPPPSPAEAAAAVAIGPDVSSAEAARDRKSTTQLLDATDNDLKRVDSKSLTADQQAMVTQIKTYIAQSRKALAEGDYERASNLAKKAQLLTDELMKK